MIKQGITVRRRVFFGFLGFLFSLKSVLAVSRFEQVDQTFRLRKNPQSAREALEGFRKIAQQFPEDPEAGWRLAMGCYFVGSRFTPDSPSKIQLFSEGRDAGLRAIRSAPSCAACHFWTAINMALYGEAIGAVKMLFSLGEIRQHAQTALKLDPRYAFGGPERLLGQIDQGLPRILGGSREDARRHYENAIAFVPDEPMNYLYLARLLDEGFNEPKLALEVAQKGIQISVQDESRIESLEAQQDLRRLIEKMKKS